MNVYLSKRTVFLLTVSIILTSCKINNTITGCYFAELSETYGYNITSCFELRITDDSLVSLTRVDECGPIFYHLYKLHKTSENLYDLKSISNDSSFDINNIPITIKKKRFSVKRKGYSTVVIKGLYKNYDWYIHNEDTLYKIFNDSILNISDKGKTFRIMGVWNGPSCFIDNDTIFSIPFSFCHNSGHFTIKMNPLYSCMLYNKKKPDDIITFLTPTIIQIKNRDLILKKNDRSSTTND